MAIPGAVELGKVRQLQPLQVLTTLREKTFPEAGDKNQSGVFHFSRAWSPKLALTWSPKLALTLSKPRFGLQISTSPTHLKHTQINQA